MDYIDLLIKAKIEQAKNKGEREKRNPTTIYKKKPINNMKRTIRLTESDLHRIISESVEKLLSESDEFNPSQRVEYNVIWEWEEYHRGDEGETETDGDSATDTFDNEEDAFALAEELMQSKIFFIDRRAGYGRKMCRIIVTKDVDYYYEEDGEPYTETLAVWKNVNNKWVEQELT